MSRDPRIGRTVKNLLHELFEHWGYFKEPMPASAVQQRFANEVYRIFGPEFSMNRFVTWLEQNELVVVLRKRTGGRFLMPHALWIEFTDEERERIRTMVLTLNSDPSTRRTA